MRWNFHRTPDEGAYATTLLAMPDAPEEARQTAQERLEVWRLLSETTGVQGAASQRRAPQRFSV